MRLRIEYFLIFVAAGTAAGYAYAKLSKKD